MFLFCIGFISGIIVGQEWEKLPNLWPYILNLKTKFENMHINNDNEKAK